MPVEQLSTLLFEGVAGVALQGKGAVRGEEKSSPLKSIDFSGRK